MLVAPCKWPSVSGLRVHIMAMGPLDPFPIGLGVRIPLFEVELEHCLSTLEPPRFLVLTLP